MSNRQRFLETLRSEAEKGLPKPVVEELVAEAGDHLEEGVAGRRELGLDDEAAERDALAAFGDARTIAKRSIRLRLSPRDRARILVLAVVHFFLYASVMCFTVGLNAIVNGFLVLATMASLLAFAGTAAYARRPSSLKVTVISLGASLASFTLISAVFLNIGAFGGSGLVYRWQGSSLAAYDAKLIEERTADRARFDTLEQGWARDEKVAGGYMTPYRVGDPNYGRIEFRVEPRQDLAAAAWADLQSNYFQRFSTDALEAAEEGTENALVKPWANWSAFVWPGAPYILLLAALVGAIDLFFGGLGAATFALRRRIRE